MTMPLKPQDILVLVKLCGYPEVQRPSYAVLSEEIGLSRSEVFEAVKRLRNARLIQGSEMGDAPILRSVEEFLIHGVKYSFPAERGGASRGMPTSYAAPPLDRLISKGDDPIPVWPDPNGKSRGLSLNPLYRSVPEAARRDPLLYERLALLDAIRDGRARERSLAEKELIKSLRNGRS